jgi:DNA-binding MarR family transcriptional regulator
MRSTIKLIIAGLTLALGVLPAAAAGYPDHPVKIVVPSPPAGSYDILGRVVAEQLGLSRAPVRDALARLAGEGLVETKPQSYTRVTQLVRKEVRDAAAVVRAMHELATRTAVLLLTSGHIEAMREANRRFEAATRAGDVDAAFREADLVVRETYETGRHTVVSLEPRVVLADYAPADETLTVYHSGQAPYMLHDILSRHLRIPEHRVRVVNKDNTVRWDNLLLQIEPTRLRSTMADLDVIVYQHLDGTLSIGYGPHTVGRYTASGESLPANPSRRPTREGHWLPLRPKRSALRASLGFTPANAPLLPRRKENKEAIQARNNSDLSGVR